MAPKEAPNQLTEKKVRDTDLGFYFLYINNSPGGKPNYEAIKDRCGMVSVNAISTRISRLKTKLVKDITAEINMPISADASADAPTTPASKGKGKTTTPSTKGSIKKRKVVEEEDEIETPVKAEDEE